MAEGEEYKSEQTVETEDALTASPGRFGLADNFDIGFEDSGPPAMIPEELQSLKQIQSQPSGLLHQQTTKATSGGQEYHAATSGEQPSPNIQQVAGDARQEQSSNPSITTTHQLATGPGQPLAPNMSANQVHQSPMARLPDPSPRTVASSTGSRSTEASQTQPNPPLANTVSPTPTRPLEPGTIYQRSGSDVPPSNEQSPGTSGTRTDQPPGQVVSSSEPTGTTEEQRGAVASEGESTARTSGEDHVPSGVYAVPEEPTDNQPIDRCTTCISMLINHAGDEKETISTKAKILHELSLTCTTFQMSSIYGLLHHCLPCMEQWQRDKLMKSEKAVYNTIIELKNHGMTIGQAVQYFMQEGNKRIDIVNLIHKIHECDFCAILKQQK